MAKLYGFRTEAALREASNPIIHEENDTWYLAQNPMGRWVVWAAQGDGEEFGSLNAALLILENEIEFQIRARKRKIQVNLAALQAAVAWIDWYENTKDHVASELVLSKIKALVRSDE